MNVMYFHLGNAAERSERTRLTADPIENIFSDHIFQNLVVDGVRVMLTTAQVVRIARQRDLFDYSRGTS